MTRLTVDLERLEQTIERLQRFQQHLARTHEEAERRVQQLQLAWTGEAAAAQATAQHHWAVAAVQVQESLASLRSIAATAHANYTAAVLANRRMWSA